MATQIVRRQIADQAIDDSKIGAGAGIQTSKLAEGGEFLKRSGSVPMTGNLPMGNNRITGLATPVAGTDAVNKDYVDNQVALAITPFVDKGKARAASTSNVTLSNVQTIDGVSVVADDRVLLKNQTNPAENGVWIVKSGAWVRAADIDTWAEIPGSFVVVQEGTVNADTFWLCTADKGGTLGTTAISFVNPFAGLSTFNNSNFVDKEVPSGAMNGSNTSFTLANVPSSGSEHVYLNGMLQEPGAGNDYTVSGSTITFTVAPLAGEKLRVSYRK